MGSVSLKRSFVLISKILRSGKSACRRERDDRNEFAEIHRLRLEIRIAGDGFRTGFIYLLYILHFESF